MTLVKPTLQLAIQNAFKKAQANKDNNPDNARAALADDLATAIDAYIKTGTVITAGTATNQTGTIS